jgi:hypothetical protein
MEWIKETFSRLGPKPKGWYTAREIMEITGNSRSVVAVKLAEMVKNGEIEVIECLENGHRIKAYNKKNASTKNIRTKRV